MDLIKTDRTYKTRDNAVKALEMALAKYELTLDNARWLIAVNDDGRFAPVVVSIYNERIPLSSLPHVGITVVG